MEPQRGRTSIEDHSMALRVESVLRRERNSSNVSLEGADFKELFFEEHRLRLELAEQNEILRIRLRHLTEAKGGYLCSRCLSNEVPYRRDPVISELKSFSELIEQRMGRMFSSMKSTTNHGDEQRPTELDIIENLSVFGVQEDTIVNHSTSEQIDDLEGKIVMAVRPTSYIEEQAAKFVFPSGMAVKRFSGERAVPKVTELITRNYSGQNSFLLSFERGAERLQHLSEESRRLLNLVNPSQRLFCVCIGTYDFTYMGKHSANTDSYSVTELPEPLEKPSEQTPNGLRPSSSLHLPHGDQLSGMAPIHEIGMTQRVYCITSYLPFFSFFEQLILSILNIVKVERLEIFKHKASDIKKIDSRFQLHRIRQVFEDSIKHFNRSNVRINGKYTLKLLNDQISVRTPLDSVQGELIQEWVYQVLSIFNVDTFVELLTLFLLEDKLVFVCENSHILTFTCYLFVEHLYRPFVYAFPSVYIAPNQNYLGALMPVVYGLLKKKKWVVENQICERYQNTYAFISPAGVHIHYTESRKDMLKKRPEKLKNLLTPFFREIEKRRKQAIKQSKSAEGDYVFHSSKEERELSCSIVQCCNRFLHEQVFKWIPQKEQMLELRHRLEKTEPPKNKDPHTYVMDTIIASLVEQRKPRDPFFEQILLTQTLNVFISQRCDYN